jgi:hypothetical protein
MFSDSKSKFQLPPGTYYLTAMLIGGKVVNGQSLRVQWPSSFTPEDLGMTVAKNAALLISDEAEGAAEGTWWLLQAMVIDAWGRGAMMARQVPIDRTLHRDELVGELGSVGPHAFVLIGEALTRTLVALGSAESGASYAPAPVRH